MTPETGHRSTNGQLPLALAAVLGCLLIAAGVVLLFTSTLNAPGGRLHGAVSSNLPRHIAGVALTSEVEGPDALAEIGNLHGKGFALVGGEVAHYGKITLWVARTEDKEAGRQMTESMNARIAEGRSPFQPTGTQQIGGHTVYMLTGMGQSHFYWQAGNQVAWLAIPRDKSEQGLKEVLAALDRN